MLVYTIGYGNQDWPRTLARLRAFGVRHLVDVRSQPFSRHCPDFRKERLVALAREAGLAYHFLGDRLGGKPAAAELQTAGKPDYAKIAASSGFAEGLRLVEAMDGPPALLCGCLAPDACHRGRLLSPELEARGHEVVHILGDGTSRRHGEVPPAAQGSLF